MKTKNPDTYRARFSKLRIHAFGKEQTLAGDFEIEIYQARVSPELWLAKTPDTYSGRFSRVRMKPASKLVEKEWRAASAERLMEHIATYFEQCIEPWQLCAPCPAGTPRARRRAERAT
jgi:hypothetical protein